MDESPNHHTELAEGFSQVLLTNVNRIRSECDSDIYDGQSYGLTLMVKLLFHIRPATESNQEIIFCFLLPESIAYMVTK